MNRIQKIEIFHQNFETEGNRLEYVHTTTIRNRINLFFSFRETDYLNVSDVSFDVNRCQRNELSPAAVFVHNLRGAGVDFG